MALVEAARFYTSYSRRSMAKGAARRRATSPAILFDTEMNWGGLDLGVVPVRLMVDEDDLAQATRILAAI